VRTRANSRTGPSQPACEVCRSSSTTTRTTACAAASEVGEGSEGGGCVTSASYESRPIPS
jgi:hypothetical protein